MTPPSPVRVTYRQVLAVREFQALLVSDGLSVVGDQVARIAVALLVFERSGSPLFAAATYALSYLTWLLGGPVLSVLSDRYPRRRVMVMTDVLRAGLVAVLAVPDLPLWAVFAVLGLVGLLAPPSDAARSALLADVLDGEEYIVANAVSNAVSQACQVVGFIVGGALVGAVGVGGALLTDAATFAASALLLTLFVSERVVPSQDARAGSLVRQSLEGARLVARDRQLRLLLLWGVLAAAVVIPPEGLAVAVAAEQGDGPLAAGVLTSAVPAGFLVGSWLLLRLPSARRSSLFPWLLTVSALPLLVTPLVDSTAALAVLWFVAGSGNSLQLIANSSFVRAVPPGMRGRAFGVAGTVLMAVQGVVLLGVGALAEGTGPRLPVALVAATAVCALPFLVHAGSPDRRAAQDTASPGREDSG